MSDKVELVPVAEGNRITVALNEKVIIGRGSSLGCNEKKISRHHAELILKEDRTLWIKPTHANPVFYRALKCKIIQLPKDVEKQLKDGDQIGLLPSSYYFRVSIPADVNNNRQSDTEIESTHESNDKHDHSPAPSKSPMDDWSPTRGYSRSFSNQQSSTFDFDDADDHFEPTKRSNLDKKTFTDSKTTKTTPSTTPKSQNSLTKSEEKKDQTNTLDSESKGRKLPKWIAGSTPSSVDKPPPPTSTSSLSRNSSYSNGNKAKRNLSFDGDSNGETNESSHLSDTRSPTTVTTSNETKSLGRSLPKISTGRNLDDENHRESDSTKSATVTAPNLTTPSKKKRKRRPVCQFGSSCYRKNPVHRTEQSHPGDSDYDDSKLSHDNNEFDDQGPDDRPECPFGKSCYRQNPQHKRDFKH